MNLDERAQGMVDARLFAAYWTAVEHFGATDLVLFFDTERAEDPVDAFVRTRMLADPEIHGVLAAKMAKPAKESATGLTGASTVFWLVVSFPGEEMVVSAVIAPVQGGTA